MQKVLVIGVIVAAMISPVVVADQKSLNVSFRIGAFLDDRGVITNSDGFEEESESQFYIGNYESRIEGSLEKELDNGLTALTYLNFGFDPDNFSGSSAGIDQTRQAWVGLRGGFGTVTVGAQYPSFYDMVQGYTDIAFAGSCTKQFGCSRRNRMLKYSGEAGILSYSASVQAFPNDDGNDAADQTEVGVNIAAGGFLLGVGAAMNSKNETEDGFEIEGGTLIGAVVKGQVGPASLALTYQVADKDYVSSSNGFIVNDDITNITLAANVGNAYIVVNQGENGTLKPKFGTVGYKLELGADASMNFEYQLIDDDVSDEDETYIRAVYRYDFGLI